jgi:hypothetical protein
MNPEDEPKPARDANLVADASGMLDRAVQQDLQRIRAESLLARQDSAQELTRALDASLAEPLVLNEIAMWLDRPGAQAVPTFSELEGLLAAPETSGLTMERSLLAELMKDGGETQSILKKGLVFLKHRRYPEALEWWTLHRQSLDQSTSRLALLLLVMETLTHIWSGNLERAAAVRAQVTAHPLFRQIKPGSPPGRPR